jgi:glycosyltransferase involved in cell wall biosynthesis
VIDTRLLLCGFSALIAAVVAIQAAKGFRLWRWQSPPRDLADYPHCISVIVPARNEEADLACSLASVLAQRQVAVEVIVVNDHSDDRTGSIADQIAQADNRVHVIHNPELRPGWLGKCNAMQTAASRATGELLLFTDADIVHDPNCFITAAMEMERRQLDFLSLFPRIDCVSLVENITLPTLIGAVAMFATPHVEDPRSSDALAAGAFLMVRSRVFREIGGLDSIKDEMLDDVALARLIKSRGYRVGLRLAPELLNVRLYKGNRHAFWGMTKNVLAGLGGRLWLAPAVALLPAFVFWTPIYCLIAGAGEGDLILTAASAATYAFQYATLWSCGSLFGFRPFKALFFPLVAIPIFFCLVRALYLYTLRGAVEWRGRKIRVRGVRTES